MAVPLKYNLRNLRVRWIATGMTVAGIGLITVVFTAMFAMGNGIEKTLVGTGHPLNLIVLRKNATETQSEITPKQKNDVIALEGIQKDAEGSALVSAELVVISSVKKINAKTDKDKANVAMRGVGPRATELRDGIKVTQGRWFKPNLGELVVGKGMIGRFENFRVGDKPFIRGREWTIVGVFEAGGQAYESEVWGHIDDLQAQFKREFSNLIVRCPNEATVKRLATVIKDDKQILLEAKPHAEYYKDQNMGAMMIKAMGFIMAIVLSIGAIFGAANTMFAAVASRTKEIATLRVLGFSRAAIWSSFTLEAAFIGMMGGALGSVVAYVFVNGMTTGTANWQTFTETAFQFQVTPQLMGMSVVMATVMGVVGGFLPAFRASRATIAKALRGL